MFIQRLFHSSCSPRRGKFQDVYDDDHDAKGDSDCDDDNYDTL